jgi:hypothetical protein
MSNVVSDRQQLVRKLDDQLAAAQRASGKSPEVILIEAMGLWWRQQKTMLAADPTIQNSEIAAVSQNPEHSVQDYALVAVDAKETVTKTAHPTLQRVQSDRTSPEEIDQELEDAKRGVKAKIQQLCDSKASYPPRLLAMSAEDIRHLELPPDLKEKLQTVFGHRACIITGGPNVEKSALVRQAVRMFGEHCMTRVLCGPNKTTVQKFGKCQVLCALTYITTIDQLLQLNLNHVFSVSKSIPTDCGLLVVGGASRVSLKLLYKVLQHLPETFGLILLGDVSHKFIVRDNAVQYLMESGALPVVKSDEVM